MDPICENEHRRSYRSLLLLAAGAGALAAARAAIRKAREINLRGKSVFITGGSRGLGLLLAREFAAEGARVAICARDAEELERAKEELQEAGHDVFTITCDVTDRQQVEDAVMAVRLHFEGLDVLVNNAGIIEVGPLELMTEQDFQEAMDTHFWAPLHATMAALPDMRRRGRGRIVNIASIGGKISVPHMLPYDASKFALVGLSEGLRSELSKYGILVTTVCPGLMRTGSHLHAEFKGKHRREFAMFTLAASTPGLSMNARRAAKQIVRAVKRGDPEVVVGFSAKLAAALHGLFPGVTADVGSLVNRALPGPGGIGTMRAKGSDSKSEVSDTWTQPALHAPAARNNELQ